MGIFNEKGLFALVIIYSFVVFQQITGNWLFTVGEFETLIECEAVRDAFALNGIPASQCVEEVITDD